VNGGWDEQMVDDIFCAQDAQIIKALPMYEDLEDF
jgi:hypothetical protein